MGNLLDRLSDAGGRRARSTPMPDWVDPMLAKLTHEYFDGEDGVLEADL